MKNVISKIAFMRIVFIMFFLGQSATAWAQDGILVSKDANFATEDRAFERTDTLYVHVAASSVDYLQLKDNEIRIKPDEGGNDVRSSMVNNLNGTYSFSYNLSSLGSEDDWEIRIELRDKSGNRVRHEINIQVGENGDDDDNDDDNNRNDEIEFTGFVTALTDSTIDVDSTHFVVTESTNITDDDRNAISISDLRVGLLVEIRADIDSAGQNIATDIHIEDDNNNGGGDDEVELTGMINHISGDTVVVSDVLFLVNDQTLIQDNDKNTILLTDLMVGMTVEIRGDLDVNGNWIASKIKIEDRIEDEVELRGVVEFKSDSTITVLDRTFILTENTEVLDHDNNPTDISAVVIGQLIEIRGTLLPGNILIALRIKLEDNDGNDEFKVTGPLEAYDTATLTVLGVTFFHDSTTQFLDDDNNTIAIDSLTIGQTVEVEANGRQDGTRLAKKVKIEDVVVSSAAVSSLANDVVTLATGQAFQLTTETLYYGAQNVAITKDDISAGDQIQVRGVTDLDGNRIATSVNALSTASATPIESDELVDRELPSQILLNQNYPNPFNPTTEISFTLASKMEVRLSVFNVLGQEVKVLIDGRFDAGAHSVTLQGADLASGVYFYRLVSGTNVATKQMVLLK